MTLPSGITLATLDGGAASETDELDSVGSGVITRALKWREDFIRHVRDVGTTTSVSLRAPVRGCLETSSRSQDGDSASV
jgi:hypothetical protein